MKEVLQMTNEELNTALYESLNSSGIVNGCYLSRLMKSSITAMSSR